ncbi:MAG: MgtC/SapB family protein [Spirochaetes bacterium]|nr:MgtC/SapB family protein [Spirochaetota bacterium]
MIDSLTKLPIDAFATILVRVLAAVLAGFLIGFERATHSQPAGIRTHMALALGACGIMIMSIMLPVQFAHVTPNGDPGRMAAQVISGIGFLGAGAIMRYGFTIKGLTTAASMWTTSGIGLIFGAGLYILGLICTLMLVFILHFVDIIESWLLKKRNVRVITVCFNEKDAETSDVIHILKDNLDVKKFSFNEIIESGDVVIEANCKMNTDQSVREIFNKLKSIGDMKSIKIE